ncbi:Treslin [Tupaia chinensis]|uniref:Treslin n=1 Tax=Tupaia chinensis TaxID=246437 RepID=L9KNR0_TUPCH|nr:Treslin [Tupaia chinensis]
MAATPCLSLAGERTILSWPLAIHIHQGKAEEDLCTEQAWNPLEVTLSWGPEGSRDPMAQISPVRRAALRLLTYLSCRFGLTRVHWAFKFFDSLGARSRPSRVSNFRELGARSWEDFEDELEARLGERAPGAHLPGPAPRATHTHSALMETLLDYQWDRPEITSPTKPILRSSGRRLLDVENEAKEAETALGGFGNAVFLLAPCPHSQRELLQFLCGCEAQTQRSPPTPKQAMEKLLPKRVQELMTARKIALYWVDTTEWSKSKPTDPARLGERAPGAHLPGPAPRATHTHSALMETLLDYQWDRPEITSPTKPILRSSGRRLLDVENEAKEAETALGGFGNAVFLLAPCPHSQRELLQFLCGCEAQTQRSPPTPKQAMEKLLPKRVQELMTARKIALYWVDTTEWSKVASVNPGEGWPPITGVVSPFAANAMVLTVLHTEEAEFQRHVLQTVVSEGPQDTNSLLSEVVDSVLNQIHNSLDHPAPPGGVPRTPVRQKMNTMCRSLKMLNVARLNVKAQKLNPDVSPDMAGEKGIQRTAGGKIADKLEDRGKTLRSSRPKEFKTEEELLSYIHETYQKTVATREVLLHSCAHNMISAIKVFLKSKGAKELEVTDLLRMVCLTEDSAYLANFLEEILGLYIDSVPKTLGNLYNSLGFVIPQKLADVLPTDFLSDDSMTQESKSPLSSVPLLSSAHRSVLGSTESEQLEELRTRSAKKRRKTALIRHKSIAEISQNLRQIEIPKVSKKAPKNENSHPALQQPPLPVKDTVQEVTKVRRNLFNQEMLSPSKRSLKRGLPRSQSVSAVEGLEHKPENLKKTKGYHRLLTKSVTETPVHKQISRRLLHRQIKGRTPPRAAAFMGTSQNKKCWQPSVPGVLQPEEPAQKPKAKAVKTPRRLENNTTMNSSPPDSPKKLCTSPTGGISKSPPGVEPPLSYSVASTPPQIAQTATTASISSPLPSKIGKWGRKISTSERSSLESYPDSPAAVTDSRKYYKKVSPSPHSSPERQSYLSTGFRDTASPLLIANDTEYLTVLDETECHDLDDLPRDNSPVKEGEGLRTIVADGRPFLSASGIPPSPPSTGPSSPLMPSCDLHCTTDRRQCQAAAQLRSLPASAQIQKASASPETYEVELEMQASGLPKLRIKKRDPSSSLENEPLRREESPLGEESSCPSVSLPQGSRSTGKPEPTYVSPPCLLPSHSTPGKSGGQTYICQSCTPTHCPSSTPSPFQTDVCVPWTPSPKHSGKTTPDTIKDWPRRKRAVDCSAGPSAGRAEGSADLPGVLPLLECEGKEQGLELSIHKTAILDFELEGVCQLPDQSPPRDSEPKAEEVPLELFGTGSRKRPLSAKEEAEYQAKRVCDSLSEDVDVSQRGGWSPSSSVQLLPSMGDDEVFISGSTPPPGCAMRSCLSASGLQALTQSPLLFQGRTPSSQCKDARDEDVDIFPSTVEDSPFSRAFSRRRPIGRTYTRKKLIS